MREIPQYGKGGWASSWGVCLDLLIFLATLPGDFNKARQPGEAGRAGGTIRALVLSTQEDLVPGQG